MERLPGTPYLAGEVIGRGPHGAVLAGRDALDRKLAIKLLTPELSGNDPDAARAFAGQRDTVLSVRHPHLMSIYDVTLTDHGQLAIVSDRAEGGNLRQALEVVRTFPPSEACRLGAQLSRALAALHSSGIAHGDLTSTNVLFNDAGSRPAVRVSDVGLTRWLAQVGRGWVPAGAVPYAAPEAAAGGVPGVPGDLYMLGALLHEMCVGVPPFVGDPADVLRRHVEEVPVRPAGIPDQVWVLIAALLAKDPATRVGPAPAVAGYLDAIAADVDRIPPAAPIGAMAAAAVIAPLFEPPAPAPVPDSVPEEFAGADDQTTILPPAAPVSYEPISSDPAPTPAPAPYEPVSYEPVTWTPPPGEPAPWERPALDPASGYDPAAYEPYDPAAYAAGGYGATSYGAAGYPDPAPAAATEVPSISRAQLAAYERKRKQKRAAIVLGALVPVIAIGLFIGNAIGGGGDDGNGTDTVDNSGLDPNTVDPGALPTDSPTPSPTPIDVPSPSVTPTPSPTPTPTPSSGSNATPTPSPTPTHTPIPTPKATPKPTPKPTPTPKPPTPTPTAAPTPTPSPTPTPTPIPTETPPAPTP